MYHNPADYGNIFVIFQFNFYFLTEILFSVIELACGEYGHDKIDLMVHGSKNGITLEWFESPEELPDNKILSCMIFFLKSF